MAGKFEPKTPVQLNPPKDDPITVEELSKANGVDGANCWVAIKGRVYDVTGNKAYQPGGSYHVFAGKDASRALGKTSTKPEDVSAEWEDLDEKEKSTLNDWNTFFSKRYNVVGFVTGAKAEVKGGEEQKMKVEDEQKVKLEDKEKLKQEE